MKHVILCAAVFFPSKLIFAQPSPPQAVAQAAPAQVPDPNAAAQPAPVTPDPNAAAQPAAPPAAPAQDVVPDQLTWPDTVDLAENAPDILPSDDPKIIDLFKECGQLFDAMTAIIDPLVKTRADLYQKYFELDAKLDEFFENIGLDEGVLQGLSPVDSDTTPSQVPTNPFKQDFDQINTQLGVITTAKESLKKSLSTFDSEIDKSKTLALQSRKKGFDILKQASEHDALGILDGINKDLAALTSIQQNLQTGATHDFGTTYDKIQADIQTLQTLVGQLRAKAIVPPVQTAPPATPAPAPVPTPPALVHKPTEQATFPHYLLTRMTELFTGAMHVASTTYTTLKDALTKSPPAAPTP